jgi:threonine/homoserine/homoserine lactone efflux protein
MYPLLKGILFGFTLTILLGPIFFSLVQTGLERGLRMGLAMCLGIFTSDLIFILAVYFGVSKVVEVTEIEGFEIWAGITGGMILLSTGLYTLLRKRPDMELIRRQKNLSASYLLNFTKGFLINTINPFTFFFWISVMTAIVLKEGYSPQSALQFFAGVMSVIIVSDVLKVVMAKYISKKLKPLHVLWLSRISGCALIIFGIVLMVRVLVQ